jgi:hypothetical protein
MKGVRTNRVTRKQAANAEKSLSDLCDQQLTTTLRQFQDLPWESFEGASERCLHGMRLHYMTAVCRNIADLCGQKKIVTVEEIAKITEANEKAKRRQEILRGTEQWRDAIY